MSIDFVTDDDKVVGTIASGAWPIFLHLTELVQQELGGLKTGFSPIVADEIYVDKQLFTHFLDTFFAQAEHTGRFRYLVRWAQEMEGIYQNLTGEIKERKMSGVQEFVAIRYMV